MDCDVRGQQEMDLKEGGSVIMDYYYYTFYNGFKLNGGINGGFIFYTHGLSLHKMSVDGLEWCGLLVDYCDVFISCLDSHSDGTHSLQKIHWWASDAMLHFSKSVLMKKQTDLHLGWPEGE